VVINNDEELVIPKKLEMAGIYQTRYGLYKLDSQDAVVGRKAKLV